MKVFETGNFIVYARKLGDAAEAIVNLLGPVPSGQRFGKRLISNLIDGLHEIDITEPQNFYLDNESCDVSLLRIFRNWKFSSDCHVYFGNKGLVVHTYPEIFYNLALGENYFRDNIPGYAIVNTLATEEEYREAALHAYTPRNSLSSFGNITENIIVIATDEREASSMFGKYLIGKSELIPVSTGLPSVQELISKQGKGVYPYKNP